MALYLGSKKVTVGTKSNGTGSDSSTGGDTTISNAVIDGAAIIYDSNYKASVYANVSSAGYIEAGSSKLGEIDAFPEDINITMQNTSSLTYSTKNSYLFGDVIVSVDDTNLIASNIKNGVSILGVTGTYGGSGSSTTENATISGGGITVNDDLLTANVTVDIGSSGYIEAGKYTTHTIDVYPISSVTPTTTDTTLETAGKYALSNITVEGDVNLIASNIKNGVSIFGVTGTYGDSSTITNIDKISVTESFYATSLSIETNRSDVPSAIYIINNNIPTSIGNSSYAILTRAMCDVEFNGYIDEANGGGVSNSNYIPTIRYASTINGTLKEYDTTEAIIYVTIPTDFSTNKTFTLTYEATTGANSFTGNSACFWGNYDIYLIYD